MQLLQAPGSVGMPLPSQEEEVWPVPNKLRAERVGGRAAELWKEARFNGSHRSISGSPSFGFHCSKLGYGIMRLQAGFRWIQHDSLWTGRWYFGDACAWDCACVRGQGSYLKKRCRHGCTFAGVFMFEAHRPHARPLRKGLNSCPTSTKGYLMYLILQLC